MLFDKWNRKVDDSLEKAEAIFQNYNQVIERCYAELMKESGDDYIPDMNDESTAGFIRTALDKWAEIPADELDGITPDAYFSGKSFEELLTLFRQAAIECDEFVPYVLLDKLKLQGGKAVDALLKMASDRELIDSEDEFLIPMMAIKALGFWKAESAANPLLELLCSCGNENYDTILEEISGALVNIGVPVLEPILEALENADTIGFVQENLLSVLSDIGKAYKSDRIYKCLKNSFLRMDNKMLGASYLGNYGDGRAIPALRGYIEKNIQNIDPETLYELKFAVERLGGSVEDIIPHSHDDGYGCDCGCEHEH